MAKGGSKSTTTQAPDPRSQAYIEQMRRMAGQGAGMIQGGGPLFTGPQEMSVADQAAPFFDPYMSNVVDATRGEFDHMRADAYMSANQQATAAGAFGGSRHGVMAGARLGEIDRAQGSTLAQLLSGGWQNAVQQGTQYAEMQRQLRERQMQEPLFRQQQALQMLNLGMGPVGSTSTAVSPRNPLGGAASGAIAGSAFGPWGAAIGGGVGLLGSLFS